MTPKDKFALLRDIQVYGCAAVEANLFLDTHPADKEAIACHAKYQHMLEEATAAYEEKYGPLTPGGASDCDCWSWIEGPWPWEYSANAPR